MPIKQYLYFDAIECLPEGIFETSTTDCNVLSNQCPPNMPSEKSRYYSQELVFGDDFQHRLGKAKYFIVGFNFIY